MPRYYPLPESQPNRLAHWLGFSSELAQRANMPREAEPSLNERAFILEALKEDIRLDGRALDAFRAVSISLSDEYGVADVTLGKTRYCRKQIASDFQEAREVYFTDQPSRILARTSATVTAPYPDRKFDGIFTINCEFSPMATPAFEPSR